uniref:Uncharacterized protein n=1 Tax=Echinococcus granulosus TaxID=6210 RepID=A0A068W9G4_ECHGR|nr:hypothetical protein EgrG_000867200 [Echinococcus granulosus]
MILERLRGLRACHFYKTTSTLNTPFHYSTKASTIYICRSTRKKKKNEEYKR